jgi:membrane protein DedA with SNARE-associated domain/rhodanese-related sulfurtransferase
MRSRPGRDPARRSTIRVRLPLPHPSIPVPDLQTLLVTYGVLLVFLNVLLGQAGLPIPAYPMLVVAGALSAQGRISGLGALLACTLACIAADTGWYWAGHRYGGRLLGTICRLSLSPDSCIRQTQQRYLATGPRLLLVAKFLPGAGALSTVMAGWSGTRYRRFVGYDLAGSMIWGGTALALGMAFHRQVGRVLDALDRYGRLGLLVALAALAAYMLWRWAQRRLLLRRLRDIPRMGIDEWAERTARGDAVVLVDVRPQADDRIPGARVHDPRHALDALVDGLPSDRGIVVYCACPNEISAAILVERLHAAGFHDAWALRGGYDAWRESQDAAGAAAAPGGGGAARAG